jgi:two-component system sensor histidine kinase MprB
VRANVELLERAPDLPAEERAQVLRGVRGQVEELTVVVGDLIDLARDGTASPDEAEELRLDDVVAGAVERGRRLQPGLDWRLEAAPSVVVGERARIHRAVMNLLDNAAKWSPPAGVVEVRVDADGTVVVRDHGPGIPEDELPLVFDRFHRAREARGLPGSGLGLAIVRQVAEAHGGAAVARNVRDGGAELVVRFSGTS